MAQKRGIWASLGSADVTKLVETTGEEFKVVSSGRHRRSAIGHVRAEGIQCLARVLRRTQSSFLLLADASTPLPSPEEMFSWAFPNGGENAGVSWGDLVPRCLARSIYPVRVSGHFDDRVATVDIFTLGIDWSVAGVLGV
jgi:hypothetical protein